MRFFGLILAIFIVGCSSESQKLTVIPPQAPQEPPKSARLLKLEALMNTPQPDRSGRKTVIVADDYEPIPFYSTTNHYEPCPQPVYNYQLEQIRQEIEMQRQQDFIQQSQNEFYRMQE